MVVVVGLEEILMRDSSSTCPWRCPCPLDCFSRPSSDGRHCCNLDSSPTTASLVLERKLLDGKVEILEKEEKKNEPDGGELRTCLKSILKQPVGAGSEPVKKGRVRWRDAEEGKELAEIREFDNEPREPVMNDDKIPICGCVIL